MRLLDTNVLIAALDLSHLHHSPSLALLERNDPTLIAAHTIAECYSTLTRGNGQYRLSGNEAWTLITSIIAGLTLVALTALQTLNAVRRFSTLGSGPRLYDFLIGATGEVCGAHTIVTWNVRDFITLFPALRVLTPIDV